MHIFTKMSEKNIEKLAEIGENWLIRRIEKVIKNLNEEEVEKRRSFFQHYDLLKEMADSCNLNIRKYDEEIKKIKRYSK